MSACIIKGKNESLIAVSVAFGMLSGMAYKHIPDWKRPAQVCLFLQFVLASCGRFCSILMVGVPSINCKVTTMFSFSFYLLFLTLMESVLLFRGLAFTTYKNTLKYTTLTLWIVRLIIGGYQVTTIVQFSKPGEYCDFFADFSVSVHQLWLQILTEVILLVPFLLKMLEMISGAGKDTENRQELLKLSIHNTGCTAMVIISQFVCTYVTNLPGIFPYLNLVFAITDLAQAFAVMNAMEVMKTTFTNMSTGKKTASSAPKSAVATGQSVH
ncbi:hypothetical protein HDV02_000640 [Globomyces sp. JEL0801]|nr:hypothetical protein HDV02_000640 [Globomyces sp. JEL0801]